MSRFRPPSKPASKFVTPETGILMNNGIMWFDPEPGGTNALAGGKRCLANYTPVIASIGPTCVVSSTRGPCALSSLR